MLEGTWAVRYTDGSVVSQYDQEHPAFFRSEGHPRGGEIPYRAIEWPKVTELVLESEHAKSTFAVQDPGPGYSVALKSRTFMVPSAGMELRCFMICTMRDDVEINLDHIATIVAATERVVFWMPDGSTHDCPHYDCPDVANWVTGLATGQHTGLMPTTHELKLATTQHLI